MDFTYCISSDYIANSDHIATLTWEIDNFDTDQQKCHLSSSFCAPSSENIVYSLMLYPKAKLFLFESANSSTNQTLIHLANPSNNSDSGTFAVMYRLSFVNVKGWRCFTHEKRVTFGNLTDVSFDQEKCTFLYNSLIDPSNQLLNEGKLTVYCEVELIDERTNVPCQTNHLLECYHSMAQDYSSLLENNKLSDVVLVVGGEEMMAHANILSTRSKVFARMFEHDFEEKQNIRVEITDVEPDAFRELLHFIYTGKIKSLEKYAVELFIAAHKYQLDLLKFTCEHYLCSHITQLHDSMADMLVRADRYEAYELKEKCIQYFTKEAEDAIKFDDWKRICDYSHELAHQLFQRK